MPWVAKGKLLSCAPNWVYGEGFRKGLHRGNHEWLDGKSRCSRLSGSFPVFGPALPQALKFLIKETLAKFIRKTPLTQSRGH